jgi:hypothetical protein
MPLSGRSSETQCHLMYMTIINTKSKSKTTLKYTKYDHFEIVIIVNINTNVNEFHVEMRIYSGNVYYYYY